MGSNPLYSIGSGLGSLVRGLPYALGQLASLPRRQAEYAVELGEDLNEGIGRGVAELSAGYKGIGPGIEAAVSPKSPSNIEEAAAGPAEPSFAPRIAQSFVQPDPDPVGLGDAADYPINALDAPRSIEEAAAPRSALQFSWGKGPVQNYTPGESLSSGKFGQAPEDYRPGGFVTGSNPESDRQLQSERIDKAEGSAIEAFLAKVQSDPFALQRERAAIDTQRGLDLEFGKQQIGLAAEMEKQDRLRAFDAKEDENAKKELIALASRRDYQAADELKRKEMEAKIIAAHEAAKQMNRQIAALAGGRPTYSVKTDGENVPSSGY